MAGDTLTGDGRANRLSGLGGADSLYGGGGDDVLVGGDGADLISGGDGNDNVSGGDGDDANLHGDLGADLISGDAGNDVLYGDDGNDSLTGGDGLDTLYGGNNDDLLAGGDGNDLLSGDAGNDTLDGGAGNDQLLGGAGDDVLSGGGGTNTLSGGDGNDTYAVDVSQGGTDTIADSLGVNTLAVSGASSSQLWLTRSGYDLRIGVIGATATVTIQDFFPGRSGATASAIKEIQTSDGSLFPKYAGALITAMTAAGPTPPVSLPDAIASLLSTYWWPDHKAAPVTTDQALAVNERSEATGAGSTSQLAGTVTVVDQDDNISGYTVATGPQNGVLSLNQTGAWTYTPSLYFNGADSFQVQVADADGHSALETISLNVSPVNSRPVGTVLSGGAATISERDRPSPTTSLQAIDLGLLQVDDPDSRAAGALGVPVLTATNNYTFTLSDNRFSIGNDSHLYLTAERPSILKRRK